MKSLIPDGQRDKTVSNIIVVAAGMIMLAILIYAKNIWEVITGFFSILSPFLLGGALAFLQLPLVRRIDWLLSKSVFRFKPHPKLMRIISSLLSLIVLLLLLSGFLSILLPQIGDSVKSLGAAIPGFVNDNAERLNQLISQYEFFDFLSFDGEKMVIAWENLINMLTNYTDIIYQNIMAISSTLYTTVLQIFVGIITAIYLLLDKERFAAQAKKVCYALMQKEQSDTLIFWMRRANRVFAGFISGKIIDSIIIGILCYLGMNLFGMEYPLLISVVVGVTNIIPYFGPFIGAIPSILILLIVNPINALWFTLFILVLQQLDGNVIGPLILGDSVGITPLWIMISIVVGSALFGIVGMLVSVPVFAVLYALLKALLETRLRKRGLPTESDAYLTAPESLGATESETAKAAMTDLPKPTLLKRFKAFMHRKQ